MKILAVIIGVILLLLIIFKCIHWDYDSVVTNDEGEVIKEIHIHINPKKSSTDASKE